MAAGVARESALRDRATVRGVASRWARSRRGRCSTPRCSSWGGRSCRRGSSTSARPMTGARTSTTRLDGGDTPSTGRRSGSQAACGSSRSPQSPRVAERPGVARLLVAWRARPGSGSQAACGRSHSRLGLRVTELPRAAGGRMAGLARGQLPRHGPEVLLAGLVACLAVGRARMREGELLARLVALSAVTLPRVLRRASACGSAGTPSSPCRGSASSRSSCGPRCWPCLGRPPRTRRLLGAGAAVAL